MLCGSRKYELELYLLSQRVEERSVVVIEELVVLKWAWYDVKHFKNQSKTKPTTNPL